MTRPDSQWGALPKCLAAAALLTYAAVAIVGCAAKVKSVADYAEPAAQAPAESSDALPAMQAGEVAYAATDRKVVRTAELRLRVKEFGEPYNAATKLAHDLGGFIQSTDVYGADDPDTPTHGTVIMRVPVERFQEALDRLRALGKVVNESISGEDVTEQFVDLESRLRNLKREEEKLLELFNRAGSVEDILQVERELARVRGEIETVEGRLRYLKDRVSLSTITVSLAEKGSVSPTPADEWEYGNVFKRAVRGLVVTLRALAGLLTWIAVYAVIWVPVVVLIMVARARRRRAKP